MARAKRAVVSESESASESPAQSPEVEKGDNNSAASDNEADEEVQRTDDAAMDVSSSSIRARKIS